MSLGLLATAMAAGSAAAGPEYSKAVMAAGVQLGAGHGDAALRILEPAARHGDGFARVMIGEIYQAGLAGVPADRRKACDEFELVRETMAEAAHNFAQCLYEGQGRTKDLATARIWYRKGIDLGFLQSSCALGNMLIRGQGGAADPAQGLAMCRASAETGDANAQADMGDDYLMGRGVARDFVQARHWYLKAAKQGQRNAAFMLASLLWNGDGGGKEQAEAARWWKVAYDNGRLDAAQHLAAWHFVHFMAAHPASDLSELDEAVGWYQAAADHAGDAAERKDALEALDVATAMRDALRAKR